MSPPSLREFLTLTFPIAQAGAKWIGHIVPCTYPVPEELPLHAPFEATALFTRARKCNDASLRRLAWAACNPSVMTPVAPLLQLVLQCVLSYGPSSVEARESTFISANVLLSLFRTLSEVPWEEVCRMQWNSRPFIDGVHASPSSRWMNAEEAADELFDAACFLLEAGHRF